ncbi:MULTISPECIES: glycosyltransferase family 4 protein [Microbacterium]|uniref:Glycosyltransferase n=1 Tax=Microbacterium wangchenii TaxID=2541726 RepID=A0ABX5SSA2_9MICO|nr:MULTISPECIES: glycosyltransferase family 4 protein [Microbacterium]MCK6066768.1 glycosyltransferase family 4 protein [Microbacterium sp. EYE_512]QBR88086.1 glycosyltransferase [Microbacterium wangchenii]TXK18124.1 glycosyltransferase family 4 protein [Microbacterium wangchenii]
MRILIVTPWFPTTGKPESGLFVAREAAALAVEHEVRVLHLDANNAPGDPVTLPGVRIARRAMRRANPLDHLRTRRQVRLAAQDADVLHTHALPLLLPWLVGRPSAGPWVHTEHWSGITAPQTLSRVERAIRRVLLPVLRRPDVVVTECERLAAAVRKHRHGPTDIVPCIVTDARPVASPRRPGVLRLVAVGGLIRRKGPDIALDTVAELRRRGRDVHLRWVGRGPLQEHLDARIRDEGLGDVVALTGALPAEGVAAELDAADIFLLPTQGDNFCVVTAEALVHGRPIVSGAATGAVDYADAAVSAFVTDQTGPAYADAVADVARRTARMSAEDIAATVHGRFTPSRVRELLTAIYSDLTR